MDIESIDVMLAKNHAPFSRESWAFEIKYDGYRVLGSPEKLRTREGVDASEWYPEVLRALGGMKKIARRRRRFIVDGEVVTLDDKGRPDFEAMAKSHRHFTYFAFDLIMLDGKDLRDRPWTERKQMLFELMPPNTFTLRYVSHVETAGEQMFLWTLEQGLEGVVAKKMDSRYIAGRNNYWYKFKTPGYHDLGFRRKKHA